MNHVTPRKRRLLHFPCVFGKHSFGAKNLQGIRIWTKILQCLGYWIKKLKTCKFWKTVWIHKVTLWIMLLRDNEGFCIFLAFPESIVLNWDFYDASSFEMNNFKGVRNWKKFVITKLRYTFCYSVKALFFAISLLVQNSCLWYKILHCVWLRIENLTKS